MIISSKINQAVRLLQDGGLVAFPTETVYGLGADASNPSALQKIFAVKERPHTHPLIVHIAEVAQVSEWAELNRQALQLGLAFWPGPLTLVLPKKAHVSKLVTGGQDTIGMRIPRHPIAQALLHAFRGGIAGPSANKFTRISPTTALAVQEELGKSVDLVLDGGECAVGLESTIVDVSGDEAQILRPGMITRAEIENVLGKKLNDSVLSTVRAPGMHFLHYAPTTKTILMDTNEMQTMLDDASSVASPAVILTYSGLTTTAVNGIHVVQMPSVAGAYAQALYQTLRSLDKQKYKSIMIEMVPDASEWEAIRDRLFKASGKLPCKQVK